ncbi:MAG TPA: hypothetical protein VFP32_00845 [Candidatus Saccharimonadales bacterium]|nr:hypothetical protein [Candidatus Saccharimonadales bacterium]
MKRLLAAAVVAAALVLPATALASIGVGVGTGKIAVSQPIKSGSIYKLPSVVVFNTGTQTATYTLAVTLNQTQPQLKPNPAWFSFSPSQFVLAPGKAQAVTPTLHPPLSTPAGDYFAYLEARPAKTVKKGVASIGVAAATKLSFKVVPSNFFIGLINRITALYKLYDPWTYIGTGLLIAAVVVILLRRRLHFTIRVTKI